MLVRDIWCKKICCDLYCFIPNVEYRQSCKRYIEKKTEADYDRKLTDDFLDDVSKLEPNATILCLGWWQEPDISVFLDRNMVDINSIATIVKKYFLYIKYKQDKFFVCRDY